MALIFLSSNTKVSPQKAPKRKLSTDGEGAENEALGETSSKKPCEDKKVERDKNNCVYKKLLENVHKKSGCTFWKNGWRSNLCVCHTCKVSLWVPSAQMRQCTYF